MINRFSQAKLLEWEWLSVFEAKISSHGDEIVLLDVIYDDQISPDYFIRP